MKQEIEPGKASIAPKRVAAGSFQTVTFTYTAGHPVDDSGGIKIAFRYAGDFGQPQFDDPQAPNYCSVATTGECEITPRWDIKGHTRPFGNALYLKVGKGYLGTGEKIIVTFGDRSGGSIGWRVQTFCEDTFEFQTHVDPIATYEFKQLPASPEMRIVPGATVRGVCVAPSQAVAGQPFTYHLKLEDGWGNPVRKPKRLHGRFDAPGVHTVRAKDTRSGLSATSNPIEVRSAGPTRGRSVGCDSDRDPKGEVPVGAGTYGRRATAPSQVGPDSDRDPKDAARPTLNRYWADFHGQSEETIGTNTIDDYFTFARDCGLVDIAGHQGNDFQVTDAFWDTINRTTRAYDKPGEFVTFPGYEWSGNTPLGGDRNIYFEREGGRIVHSCADLLPGKQTKYAIAMRADELFAKLARQRNPRAFAFAHVGGRYADARMHDPGIELAMEVHAAWGTFEWLLEDAFQRGYRIGICANSDGHKGRPGASYPGAKKFGSLGGLTCVLARKLDRAGVLEALRARHIYATTGHRPLLDVRLHTEDGRSAMMGDVIEADTATLDVAAVGTGPIERVEVRNGAELLKSVRPYGEADLGRRIKISWSGAEVRGRGRLSEWHGGVRVKGNRITNVQPVNFWRADQQPVRHGSNRVEWTSFSTGGVSAVILTLARPNAGRVELETTQRNVTLDVKRVGLKPRRWACGGLNKQIEIVRLPDPATRRQARFRCELSLPIRTLKRGDNPLYVRVLQEDGHMAWSSPVYVVA